MNKYRVNIKDEMFYIFNMMNKFNATDVKQSWNVTDSDNTTVNTLVMQIKDFEELNYVYYPDGTCYYIFNASYVRCDTGSSIRKVD